MTYEAIMPRVENNSYVFGFARAYDLRGNIAESHVNEMYYYTSPNPNSSSLRLSFFVRHIDPRNLQINFTVNAWLVNAVTYLPELLQDRSQSIWLPVSETIGPYSYQGQGDFRLYYSSGQPPLFPFDRYDYTFELLLPKYLNSTGVIIESKYGYTSLKPNSPAYAGLIGEEARTQDEALDNAIWDVQSVAQYHSSQNFTASPPYLRVTITLTRQPETVNYLLLIPTFSLYALLGLSVLLRGKDQLQNRLLLYITVFGFSYTLQPTIKATAPIVFGFSMMDRVTIALIPCTVILSACSIISMIWNEPDPQNDSVSGWDIAGVIGAALALYLITSLTVTDLLGYYRRTFTLFDTGPYGLAVLGVLFLGFVIRRPLAYFRQHSPQIARRLREFPLQLYRHFAVHRRKDENRAGTTTTTETQPDTQMISTTMSTPVKLRRSVRAQTSTSRKGKLRSRNRKRQSTPRRYSVQAS
jgi:hypothetical protein